MGSISQITVSNSVPQSFLGTILIVISQNSTHPRLFMWFSPLRRASPTPWALYCTPPPESEPAGPARLGPYQDPSEPSGPRCGHIGCSSHSNLLDSNAFSHCNPDTIISALCMAGLVGLAQTFQTRRDSVLWGQTDPREMSLCMWYSHLPF